MNKDSMKKSMSVRMGQELYLRTAEKSKRAYVTVAETIRASLRQFNERDIKIEKVKKILRESRPSDFDSVIFEKDYITNKTKLYIHHNAQKNIDNLDEKCRETIMNFMKESICDGTLMTKCRTETCDATNIISFKVKPYDVYCDYGSAQITILSVS